MASRSPAKPLLKWVGGKRQLLPALRQFYPRHFDGYIEPFFGSGAVFFDLWQQGRLDGKRIVLIDSNPDLIGCYQTVRESVDAVIRGLHTLADGHAREGREHYYRVRDSWFNPLRAERRGADGNIAYTPELAAMLIYLNRTGFNGLFRVNASGAFNVPIGRYARPRIADDDRLRQVANALSAPGVDLRWGTFRDAEAEARRGDFLYIDPPYAALSATSSFTAYTSPRFGDAEQRALQQMVLRLARQRCHVLVSNSTAPSITALYDGNPDTTAVGLRALRVPARRAVNSKATRRGAVDEYVITNLPRLAGHARGLRSRPNGPAPNTRRKSTEKPIDETARAGDS